MTGVTVEVHEGRVRLADRELFTGTDDQLVARVADLVNRSSPSLVVTPNVDQVLELQDNSAFREAYDKSELRLVDGMPLVLLARVLGAKDVQRHTGADLLPTLTAEAARRTWRIAITGGADHVIELAVARLRVQVRGADVTGVPFPRITSPSDESARAAVEQLRALEPDIVFLCLGAPKQELWFAAWRDQLPPAVFIGAGAAVDFAAGTVRRAPRIVQQLSLEWVWRLAREPRRLARRYLVRGPKFLTVIGRSIKNGRVQ